MLTGTTDAMVAASRLDQALPAFLELARGTVLMAHNAPFDLGFLKAGCEPTSVAAATPSCRVRRSRLGEEQDRGISHGRERDIFR